MNGDIPIQMECDEGDHVENVPQVVGLTQAETLQEYFDHPEMFIPHPDFIRDNYFIEDDTTLILAIRNLNVAAVIGLLAAGINPNTPTQKGVTPISAAAHKGNTVIIEKLVDAGASVNAINSTGSTALIQASHFGHLDAVKVLLKHGGIADFANSKGTTALMRASQEGYVDIVVTLLDAKSEVNRKNNEGMNSLMLASQRGHEKVVVVLVKYGAAMDEQTSQGSTALMLACKRGHERVVEVLVACGAEIYMRDCRARSARDTAVRRQHGALLAYLDTQVQVKCLQETVREERAALLRDMRRASILNRLEYCKETQRVLRIMQEVNRFECLPDGTDRLIGPVEFHKVVQSVLGNSASTSADALCASYENFITSSPSSSACIDSTGAPLLYRSIWSFPTDVCVTNVNSPVNSSFIASAPYRARHPLPAPNFMSPHRPGYAPWQWPFLLKRVFDLPLGVHELVIEFLPSPRIWKSCIHRLKRRVALAPQAATLDISILIDEMITDMCIFNTPQQQSHLVTMARNDMTVKYLSEQWHMPSSLLEELVTWSDVQSLIARSADCDITFKPNLARKFLLLAASLYRFLSSYSNPRVLFSMSTARSLGSTGNGGGFASGNSISASFLSGKGYELSESKYGKNPDDDANCSFNMERGDLMEIDIVMDTPEHSHARKYVTYPENESNANGTDSQQHPHLNPPQASFQSEELEDFENEDYVVQSQSDDDDI